MLDGSKLSCLVAADVLCLLNGSKPFVETAVDVFCSLDGSKLLDLTNP